MLGEFGILRPDRPRTSAGLNPEKNARLNASDWCKVGLLLRLYKEKDPQMARKLLKDRQAKSVVVDVRCLCLH